MEVFQFHNNLSTNFNCVHHFEQEAWKIHQFAQPYNLEFIEQVSYLPTYLLPTYMISFQVNIKKERRYLFNNAQMIW